MTINDPQILIEGFTATRYDLAALARYYTEMVAETEFHIEVSGDSGSGESRTIHFALGRLKAISEHLGDEEREAEVGPIEDKWRSRFESLTRCEGCVMASLGSRCDCENCGSIGWGAA